MKRAQQVQDTKKKLDDLTFTEEEEQTIGLDVSQKVRQRFGVVQDPAVHKYVSLVGTTLAKQSERPDLPWTFIVLDTDGVNAFASPGGYVHITRGALASSRTKRSWPACWATRLATSCASTPINAMRKNNAVQAGASAASEPSCTARQRRQRRLQQRARERLRPRRRARCRSPWCRAAVQGRIQRQRPRRHSSTRLDERNKDQAEKNGLFASHPDTKERIDKATALAKASKTTGDGAGALQVEHQVPARAPSPRSRSLPTVRRASRARPSRKRRRKSRRRRDSASGALKPTVAPEKQSTQVSASGGARGVGSRSRSPRAAAIRQS